MSDIFILAPDPNGECCDCSTRMSVCDECTVSPCSCSFFFPTVLTSPLNSFIFDNLSDAQNALSESCVDCVTISRGSQFVADSGVAATSISSGSIGSVSAVYPSFYDIGSAGYRLTNSLNYIGVALNTGDILPITYDVSTDATFLPITAVCSNGIILGVSVEVYDCATGSIVWYGSNDLSYCDEDAGYVNVTGPSISGDIVGISGYTSNFTALSNSIYFFYVVYTYGAQGGQLVVTSSSTVSTTTSFSIPSNRGAVPVIAKYTNLSDPTTPLELEACPKLTLPLPDSGSPYYLFLADAQSALDLFVSNCVGYCALGNTPGAHFTATDGGTTLTLDAGITTSYTDPGCTSDEQAGFEVAGSVSVQPTSTLHCDYSISGSFTQNGTSTVTGFIVEFVVFDQDNQFYDSNTIILSSSGGSGTQDFSITTAGKYTVITRFEITTSCLHPGGAFAYTINGNTVLYSDMTMTINPAEALYRNLGNCVSHLDCTP